LPRAGSGWSAPAAALALVAVGAFAWWLELRPRLAVDASALTALPVRLGAWRAEDVPIDPAVEAMLDADLHVQRVYLHPTGGVVWLYLGYYGTTRGGRPEHLPPTCYEAHGWRIADERRLSIDPARGLRAEELLVERDGERRLVQYWFRSHRGTGLVGSLALSVDHLLGRLASGRADGALVRISTPLESADDDVAARSRLAGFAALLDPLLAERWPAESAAGPGRG
jgi:EpsI family protein